MSEIARFQSYEIAPVRIEDQGARAIADRDTKAACEDLLYRITGHRNYYFNRLEEEEARMHP